MRIIAPSILSLLLALAVSCAGKAPLSPPSSVDRIYGSSLLREGFDPLLRSSYDESREVPVIFATNRVLAGGRGDCTDDTFGSEAGSKIVMGICHVNVPKRHVVGNLETGASAEADRTFQIISHDNLSENSLKLVLQQRQPADLLLFVHGFNVKFEEAVFRAAQLAYDLKFQGPVLLFSWPAGASSGGLEGMKITKTYRLNRANAEASIAALAQLLRLLKSFHLMRAHIFVHSMGHQVVLPALAQLSQTDPERWVGELILNAPDIGIRAFQSLTVSILNVVDRITLYCSRNDNALAASERYNGEQRMGMCERMSGIDVINVGEIDAPSLGVGGLGHGYYASRPILTDIHGVLLGIPARYRLFVRKSEPDQPENYYLRP
ncbi:MAG: alpha/beta hydrolase [Pseudomonadota bacterium]